MTPEQLIITYGYLAVFVGTFLEGETVLILGGFAAHQGYLHLSGVMAAAGYIFGHTLEIMILDIKRYELEATGAIIIIAVIFFIGRAILRRRMD